jgi:hypothetical protein
MFLNYLAGAISLVLAVSAFIPWVTVWFYSLKGVESIYGIVILLVALLGVMVSGFQYLSGRNRGRAFIAFSLVSLACEGMYFKKMADYGAKLNEVVSLLKDLFGDAAMMKVQELLGEQWTKVLSKVVSRFGVSGSVDSCDFVGGGLILAVICSVSLLVVGILIEKNQGSAE